jgi:uncharacterized protein (UPF0276 family)
MIKLKLAIAVSDLFLKPSLKAQALVDLSDTLEIKFLPVPEWIPKDKTLIFHSGFGLVEEKFQNSFTETLPFLMDNGIELYSCDLGPAAERYIRFHPLSPTLSREGIEERIARGVDFIRKTFQFRLAVENYNYYPTGLYEHICQPDFITYLTNKYELGLVLDLAHAAVTAHNFNVELTTYFGLLPLDKLVEIHLSRPHLPVAKKNDSINSVNPGTKSEAYDAHQPPGSREYRWLEAVIDRLPKDFDREVYLVVEYYQQLYKLPDILEKAKEFCENLNAQNISG